MQTAGRRAATREFGEVLPSLQGTAGISDLVQVYGTGSDGGGRKLAGCGSQPEEGGEDLDADDEDPGPGGGRPEDIEGCFLRMLYRRCCSSGQIIGSWPPVWSWPWEDSRTGSRDGSLVGIRGGRGEGGILRWQ